jgi:hypothetical protein
MPGMHILQALREKKSDQSLFQTCTYLATNNTDALEDEWIAVLAEVGMSSQLYSSKTLWMQLLADLQYCIQLDALDITDALVLTTKLYLLYQRTATSIPDSLTRLRAQVIDHFPDNVQLSYKGIMLFSQILPGEEAEELHAFGHRILSGFIKLFYSKHPATANAVEFIARKKCAIQLPKVWPAPNPQEAGRGDPVWFVWGAVLLYFPNDIYIQTAWTLFCLRWKKKYKMERLGLLVGSAVCATNTNDVAMSWTHDELKVIEHIAHLAPDLWAAHTPPHLQQRVDPESNSDSSEDTDPLPMTEVVRPAPPLAPAPSTARRPVHPRGRAHACEETLGADFLTNFMPRRQQPEPDPDILALPASPYDHQIRVISIKADKKRNS